MVRWLVVILALVGGLAQAACENQLGDSCISVFPGGVQSGPTTFAVLPDSGEGVIAYCTDCQPTTPCTGGGSGALAVRDGTSWDCFPPGGTLGVAGSDGNVLYNNGGVVGGSGTNFQWLDTFRVLGLETDTGSFNGPWLHMDRTSTGNPVGPRFYDSENWYVTQGWGTANAVQPWEPSTYYFVNDTVWPREEPNGRLYQVVTEGRSGSSFPWGSDSNTGGPPRRRLPHTAYVEGERIWPGKASFSSRRYRVQGDCVSGSGEAGGLTWCTTLNCDVSDGTCTYRCSDDNCDADSAYTDGFTDNDVTWDDDARARSFPHLLHVGFGNNLGTDPSQFIPMNDRLQVLTHSDNPSFAVIADRGNVADPVITSINSNEARNQLAYRFITNSMSPRGNRAAVNVTASNDTAVAVLNIAQARSVGASEKCDNPHGEPALTVDGVGTWTAGCHWFCYSWECGSNMIQRTECSRYGVIYLDGTEGVSLAIRESYPTDAVRTVWFHSQTNGASQAACDALSTRPAEMFREAWFDDPTTNETYAAEPVTFEGESSSSFNNTYPSLVFTQHPAMGTGWTASTAYAGSGATMLKVQPQAVTAGGGGANGWYYGLVGTCGDNTDIGGSSCTTPAWSDFTCTSGATEPTWPTTPGAYVIDGAADGIDDCIWKAIGPTAQHTWWGNDILGGPVTPMHSFRDFDTNQEGAQVTKTGFVRAPPTDAPGQACDADHFGTMYFDDSRSEMCVCKDKDAPRWCVFGVSGECGDGTNCSDTGVTTTTTSTSSTSTIP